MSCGLPCSLGVAVGVREPCGVAPLPPDVALPVLTLTPDTAGLPFIERKATFSGLVPLMWVPVGGPSVSVLFFGCAPGQSLALAHSVYPVGSVPLSGLFPM